jgi:NAD(P)-dependent dehydrogenase (short-subunit alcohol dehydrogenase family)
LEIVRQLAQAGASVIIGARDAERGNAAVANLFLQGLDATFVQLDLIDELSIAAAASTISNKHSRLDILVNNASVVDRTDGAPNCATLQADHRVFETNFFGT